MEILLGVDGKNEIILGKGDIISMPTNMFRGFENAGDEEALRVVMKIPDNWLPGLLNGEKVKAKYSYPVVFSIE